MGAPDARGNRPGSHAALAALCGDAIVFRAGGDASRLAARAALAIRCGARALADADGPARVGRAPRPAHAHGHDVLRHRAPLGAESPALSALARSLGGTRLGAGGGDLILHGPRAPEVRRGPHRG